MLFRSGDEVENTAFFDTYRPVADEVALEKPHSWLSGDGREWEKRKICPQPFKMLSIRWNGDVIVCDPDWPGHTKVGNALNNSIEEIWHSKKLRDFWLMQAEGRRMENESCRNCSFVLSESYALDDIEGLDVNQLNS